MKNTLFILGLFFVPCSLYLNLFTSANLDGAASPVNSFYNFDSGCKSSGDYLIFNPQEKITLIGIDDVTKEDLSTAQRVIISYYGLQVEIGNNIPMVNNLYVAGRDPLIDADRFVRNFHPEHKTIYITKNEMYGSNTYCRGYTTVMGTVALVRTGNFFAQTLIHELGHTYGLLHCEDLSCVMAIYNDDLNKGTLCDKCRSKINFR